jgi:DNA-binding response OmpR family regulator
VIEQNAKPFDLVVTEMILPVMSGYKLGRRLARQRPELPVLYMSATTNETLVRSGPPSGQAGFLRKPFRPEDLVRQVTASLTAAGSKAKDTSAASRLIRLRTAAIRDRKSGTWPPGCR